MPHAISAGHEITLDVAKEILQAKGNAFDAAIAAHFAMFITEPCMASAGGSGFALCKPINSSVDFFDFFCQTPKLKNTANKEFFPIYLDFGTEKEEFHIGIGSAAVPGTIAGLLEIHKRFGTIPISVLIEPAKQLAQDGVILNTFQSDDLKLLEPIFGSEARGQELFFKNEKIKQKGDKITMPFLSDFLDFIADEGTKGFYYGDIAQSIIKDCKNRGGFLQRSDFENYQVNIGKPLHIPYKNKIIHTANGPSKGGAALGLMLAQTTQEIASIAHSIKQAQLILKENQQVKIELDGCYPENNFQWAPGVSANSGTTHFNILDNAGNAICITSSIGEGCGYFIPHTDMQLNNMLGEIFLLPDGAHSWIPNQRMNSMMTPTMLTDAQGKLEYIGGSGGASRIPYAIGQVLYHMLAHKNNLESATKQSRYHFQNDKIQVEYGAEWDQKNEEATLWDQQSLYFGGVHSIVQGHKKIDAMGDARRYGVAEIF